MKKRTATPKWRPYDKRWTCQVQKDGIRKSFYSSRPGPAGRIECMKAADAWLLGETTKDNPKVSEALAAWLSDVKDNTSEEAWLLYDSASRNYIEPALGSLRVDQLNNEQMFQTILNNAHAKGVKGAPLSKASLMNIRVAIVLFLKYCRKCGYNVVRPEELKIPKTAQGSHRKIMQPSDVRTLFACSEYAQGKPEWFIHAYRFQVLTGLRPGELIGLQWGDIREGVATIRRSVNARGKETPGKNANARRTFFLPARAVAVLDEQRKQLESAGLPVYGSAPVFPDRNGKTAPSRIYRTHLARYCEANGITVVCPYELRHTWYSMNKELPSELVKAMGGHSESMDTFGVYGHEVDGDKARTAHMLDDVASRILGDDS